MTNARPLIHVVDDDMSHRTALSRLLEASGYRVALHASAEELLADPPASEPGCILLDVRMEGLSGLQLQERLAQLGHAQPIVFLTGYADVPSSVLAIKAGAEDFLVKPAPKERVLVAVERAIERSCVAQKERDRIGGLHARLTKLTRREREVFDLVARGRLNKQIAYQLGTCERTIKAHRQSIMHKLQVRSLAELVVLAERLGLLAEAG